MARKRAAQQAQSGDPEGAPGEEQPEESEHQEEARTSQVERYLEGLGIKVGHRPAPQPAPSQPAQPRPAFGAEPRSPAAPHPAQAPSEGQVVYQASPADVQRFRQERQGHPAAHPPAAPQRPHRVRVAAPAPQPEPAQQAPAPPKAPASTAPRPRRRPLGVLGHRPTHTELQKAVILSEVIRRPDFSRDPFERSIVQ